MMNRKKESFAYVGLIFLFICILFSVRFHGMKKIHADLDYHTQALSSYAWDMDVNGMDQYLTLAVNNNRYKFADFFDDSTKRITVKVEGPLLEQFSSVLLRLGILHSREERRVVVHDGEPLGYLTVSFYNYQIYIYAYIFLILLLMLLIEFLVIRLLREREALEIRVGERTAELEKEIRIRRMTEKDLHLTLNSIGDGVLATDLEGRITRMNPVAENLIGWDFEEIKGKLLDDYYQISCTGNKGDGFDFLENIAGSMKSHVSYKKEAHLQDRRGVLCHRICGSYFNRRRRTFRGSYSYSG